MYNAHVDPLSQHSQLSSLQRLVSTSLLPLLSVSKNDPSLELKNKELSNFGRQTDYRGFLEEYSDILIAL